MRSLNRITPVLIVGAFVASACSGDSQTKNAVATEGPAAATTTSISGDSADKSGTALVRVINAAPTSTGLVVRTDESHALPAVEYKKVTPYQQIDKSWVTFQVRGDPSLAYEPLETNREMLTDGHRYSLIVIRDDEGKMFKTRVVRDDISADSTKAHVRVIHAAVNIGEVNVVAKGMEKLFDGVNFTSEAGFKDISAWSGTLEFRTEDGNKLLLSVPNLDFKLGKSYTIVLSRGKTGKLEAFWFDDAQTS